jgi:ribosomal RNA assembly protein
MAIHKSPAGVAEKKQHPENMNGYDSGCFDNCKIIRIPKRRMEALNSCKSEIEKRGKVKIEITDAISVSGEPLNVFVASSVVTAIGRGFDYVVAAMLFEDYLLYVINIAKNQKNLVRIRSRLIGTMGKVRRKIEEMTGTRIVIFGKTASIIGKDEGLENARFAIENIIEGKSHSMVFKFLEAKDKN